jgi:hypothetical protein
MTRPLNRANAWFTNAPRGRRRSVLTLGALCIGFAALALGLAAPAAADPTTTYVAVGSDTTQDVMDQFAASVGRGTLGSWDAVNPGSGAVHEDITPKAGCHMTRPNGSTEGLNALRKSLNAGTTAPQLPDPPEPGCVDIARSSSGPGGNANPSGQLAYIPFALDAVATATGPATAVGPPDPAVATAITQADAFTQTQVAAMYDNCTPQTVNGVTYDPTGATGTPIHLYLPQAGSGTRNFWATTLGFNVTTPPSCVHDHSVLDPNEAIEEHDGTIYAQDANAFGPFSIAQWVSQKNHPTIDRRHNAVLHSLNGVAPLTTGGTLNTAYPIKREVYNVALFSAVSNGSGGAGSDPVLSNLLAARSGFTPSLCAAPATIVNFGFALLTGAPLGHTCGQIATDLRAFATI